MSGVASDPLSLAQAAAERAQRRADTPRDRQVARNVARTLERVGVALAAGNVSRARDLLVDASVLATRVPETPALLRNIEDALAALSPAARPGTIPTGWRPTGVLAGPGDLGPWAKVLGGSISPCSVVDFGGRRLLYVVGASGLRKDDGGPAWRALGALELAADGRIARNHGVVIEHTPSKGQPGDEEEGIFSAVTGIDGDELRLYAGEVYLTSPGNVDVRTTVYTSRDGLRFRRVDTISERRGSEIGPVAVWAHGGRDYVLEFHKQVPGWVDWQLGVNSDPVQPRVTAVGASGPFQLDGGRLALLVVEWGSSRDEPVPILAWYSFDPADPIRWRREDAPPLPIAHEVAIAPDMSRAWALDSWQTGPARIVTLERTDSGNPIEIAAPHALRSDPRAWPVDGTIAAVEWGSDLVVRWRGVDQWRRYESEGRWLYGHLCAVVRDASGRWVVTGFEHLANAPGAAADVVDTRFEHLADPRTLGEQMQLPGKRFERGEEFYLFAAAPCRIGGGVRYPQDAGLLPVRTRFAKVRFGVDGVDDAEPPQWWA